MRNLSAALALLLALPATAQPYASVGAGLVALGCDRACVCSPTCPRLRCERVDLTVPLGPDFNWRRYGFVDEDGLPERPLHISDGTHSAGLQEAKAIILSPADPLRLVPQPYSWTITDEADLSKLYCGSVSARSFVISRFGSGGTTGPTPPPFACPAGWRCPEALPEAVRVGCASATLHCTVTSGIPLSDARCYREAGLVGGRPWVQLARRCDWRTQAPPPPPPEPRCGDGQRDLGETCATCLIDMPAGACEVPEPIDGCGEALDALREALERAEEVCRG